MTKKKKNNDLYLLKDEWKRWNSNWELKDIKRNGLIINNDWRPKKDAKPILEVRKMKCYRNLTSSHKLGG